MFSFTTVAVVLILVVLVAAAAAIALRGKRPSDGSAYLARPLMTDNELEFFSRLKSAVPEMNVFPQVSFGALLSPAEPAGTRAYMAARGRFSQKIADFVLCDQAGRVVAVVELDDRTHSAERDAKRDSMLQSAGYRVLRFHSKRKPEVAQIREVIIQAAANAPARPAAPASAKALRSVPK